MGALPVPRGCGVLSAREVCLAFFPLQQLSFAALRVWSPLAECACQKYSPLSALHCCLSSRLCLRNLRSKNLPVLAESKVVAHRKVLQQLCIPNPQQHSRIGLHTSLRTPTHNSSASECALLSLCRRCCNPPWSSKKQLLPSSICWPLKSILRSVKNYLVPRYGSAQTGSCDFAFSFSSSLFEKKINFYEDQRTEAVFTLCPQHSSEHLFKNVK